MIADIIGVDVITVEAEEGPAFGAAILAMVGTKTYKTVEQACEEIVNLKAVYRPNIKNSSISFDSWAYSHNDFRSICRLDSIY